MSNEKKYFFGFVRVFYVLDSGYRAVATGMSIGAGMSNVCGQHAGFNSEK